MRPACSARNGASRRPKIFAAGHHGGSSAASPAESADLIEPIAAGALDWLEVHELHQVVSGELSGRQSDEDVVVFKSNGLAAWDVAVAARVTELATAS